MVRKIAIGLAALAITMGGATLGASAHGGGHGGGYGFAKKGGGGFGHHHEGWRGRSGYYRYGSYRSGRSCWRDGVWVCPGGGGYYGPSYYRYGYHRGGRGFRGGHAYGMHGGGGHGGRR
jgi:hypothetical protein